MKNTHKQKDRGYTCQDINNSYLFVTFYFICKFFGGGKNLKHIVIIIKYKNEVFESRIKQPFQNKASRVFVCKLHLPLKINSNHLYSHGFK